MHFNFHTHKPDYQAIVNHFAQEPTPENEDLIYSVGIHPWHIHQIHLPSVLEFLKEKANKNYIKAIGECGYDVHAEADKDLQLQMFEQHIVLAERLRKPLILHWVKGWDLLENRLKMGIRVPIAIHGFSAKKEVALQLLKYNVYFSFGAILFNRNAAVQQYLRNIPLDRIFLETDDENMTIESVYLQASQLLNLDIQELDDQMSSNILRFFNKSK